VSSRLLLLLALHLTSSAAPISRFALVDRGSSLVLRSLLHPLDCAGVLELLACRLGAAIAVAPKEGKGLAEGIVGAGEGLRQGVGAGKGVGLLLQALHLAVERYASEDELATSVVNHLPFFSLPIHLRGDGLMGVDSDGGALKIQSCRDS